MWWTIEFFGDPPCNIPFSRQTMRNPLVDPPTYHDRSHRPPCPASRTSAWEDKSCHTGTAAAPGTKTCRERCQKISFLCHAVLSVLMMFEYGAVLSHRGTPKSSSISRWDFPLESLETLHFGVIAIYGKPLYVWDVFKWSWFWQPPKTNSWHGPFKELPAWNGLKLRKQYWLHLSTSLVFRHSSFYATQKTLLQSHKLLHKSAVKRIVGRAYWIYMLNNVLNIVASMAQAKWFGKRCLVRLERLKAIFASVATPDCCLPIHMDEETQPSNPCTSSRMAKWHSNLQSVHVTARSYPWIYPCHSLCQGTERPSTRRLMPQGAEKLWKNGKAESHWGSSSQIWLNKIWITYSTYIDIYIYNMCV